MGPLIRRLKLTTKIRIFNLNSCRKYNLFYIHLKQQLYTIINMKEDEYIWSTEVVTPCGWIWTQYKCNKKTILIITEKLIHITMIQTFKWTSRHIKRNSVSNLVFFSVLLKRCLLTPIPCGESVKYALSIIFWIRRFCSSIVFVGASYWKRSALKTRKISALFL